YFDAGRCFDIAVSMAPDNSEYRTARETLRRRTAGTAQGETQQYYGCCSSDGCCDCMRMCCFMRFCC
ncbi:MAG: hypothetical protein MJ102_06675, partial [Clostridia bacterium]|nr:hypothetical protein [Clostridia bacterium]